MNINQITQLITLVGGPFDGETHEINILTMEYIIPSFGPGYLIKHIYRKMERVEKYVKNFYYVGVKDTSI